MKNQIITFFATSVMFIFGCCRSGENTVLCVQLDPLDKVFTEESSFVENTDTVAIAKGETATFQFVMKSAFPIQGLKVEAGDLVNGNRQIAVTEKAFVGYIRAGFHAGTHGQRRSKDAVFPVSDLYPDCLQEVESVDVASMSNQPVWIEYAIPRDAADGNYTATLTFTGRINGKPFKINKIVNIKVYPVALPEQTLWVTNWFSTNGLSKMNGNEPVEPYSDRYWELLTALAHVMRDHGQNTYLIGLWDDDFCNNWGSLCNIQLTGTQYSFDFTNFDRTVELFIREGGLKYIEGGHLGGRSDWEADCEIRVPNVGMKSIDDKPAQKYLSLSIDDESAQNYLSQFLPALYSHLKAKGWDKMYVQHLADEPIDKNALSYIRIAEFVKTHMPDIPIMEAVQSYQLDNTVGIWIPQLDKYHHDYAFFRERQIAGDQVWFYTCMMPQNNYANRFLEQPLIQTRFLHWINYRYGSTGYLHWGFNWWHVNTTNDAGTVIGFLPAGDAWIVYPAKGKVYPSIRLKAMRDGIADYELLKLLEQKSPDKAKKIVGEVIKDFDNYFSNVRAFRLTRLKLLKALTD